VPYTRGNDSLPLSIYEMVAGYAKTREGGKVTNGDSDYWFGEDDNHGGRGNDHIVGNLMSEKHYGGRGSDTLVDYKSGKRPDTFRCGPGLDYVYYNKGLDKVAADCEMLWAARPINVTPY
jgi:hypothetical protein